MEERSLRDVERWKDKIEVRLDNRQVFFLFFGSALTACLLFVLGVIVGKRLESRGRAAVSPEIEDPLALLDRVAATTTTTPAPPERPAAPRPAVERKPVEKPAAAPEPAPEKPTLTTTRPEKPAPAAKAEAPAAEPKPGAKARFTLQLSSFQDRAEAEAFAKRFEFASPYIVTSTIPGKGTWYRVRAGDYGSAREAATAKDAFEKQHNTIAYVAPR